MSIEHTLNGAQKPKLGFDAGIVSHFFRFTISGYKININYNNFFKLTFFEIPKPICLFFLCLYVDVRASFDKDNELLF